jgi:hypothetical protein
MEEDYASCYNRLVATPYHLLKDAPDQCGAKEEKHFWLDRINYEMAVGITSSTLATYKDFIISCVLLGKHEYLDDLLKLETDRDFQLWNFDIVAFCYKNATTRELKNADIYAVMLIKILKTTKNQAKTLFYRYTPLFQVIAVALKSCDTFRDYMFNDLLYNSSWKTAVVTVIVANAGKSADVQKFVKTIASNITVLLDYLGNTERKLLSSDVFDVRDGTPKLSTSGEAVVLSDALIGWFYKHAVECNNYAEMEKALEDERVSSVVHSLPLLPATPEMAIVLGIKQSNVIKVNKSHKGRQPTFHKYKPIIVTEGRRYEAALEYLNGNSEKLRKYTNDNKHTQITLVSPLGNRSIFVTSKSIDWYLGSDEIFPRNTDKGMVASEYLQLFKPGPIEQIQVIAWDHTE